MALDLTTILLASLGGVVWLLRLEAKVLAVEKYIVDEPKKFESRIEKVEHEISEVRANLNQISVDVSFIRGLLTERKME